MFVPFYNPCVNKLLSYLNKTLPGSTAPVVAGAGRYPKPRATLTRTVAETQLAIPAGKQYSLLTLTKFAW